MEGVKLKSTLFEVKNLKTYFPVNRGFFRNVVNYVHAVDDISLEIMSGETLGLVGESGCGKTTFGRTIIRLVPATSGEIIYKGENLIKLDDKKLRALRGEIQIVFQDPYSSLNPKRTVSQMLNEILMVRGGINRAEANERTSDLLIQVGLSPIYAARFPHEFSGGQRQRIAIARAIALNPKFVVCDEAVSALDVSIQSQVINLLIDIKAKSDMTYLFISHDLKVVQHISDRVAVMYLGQIVEIGPTDTIFENPLHPYTKALLSAALTLDKDKKKQRIILEGETPSATIIPKGCRFNGRCWKATEKCRCEVPKLEEVSPGHSVSCFYIEE